MLNKLRTQKGFTIIEVVLVLAIAGLIFLVVFLALPQLQRSRRDTQRRSDLGRILASLETYAGNHNGEYPKDTSTSFGNTKSDEGTFLGTYYGSDNGFEDPLGPDYVRIDVGDSVSLVDPGELDYNDDGDCAGETTGRTISITMQLEQDTFCQDNY